MPPTSSPESIGLIGAGLMGAAMAERLVGAGFRVVAWDRDAARVELVSALGANAAGCAEEIGASCERVILSLPDSKVVATVLVGLGPALRAGAVVVDTSTGEPAESVRFGEELAKRGVAYLDATFSGSSEQLRRGEGLWMVGGADEAFVQCADVMGAFGGGVRHVGGSGAGARLKLVTNLVLGLNRAALAEGLALAEAMGLDPRQTMEVLQASAAYSRIMETKGEKMVSGDFQPVARLWQHHKDVRLMLQAADEVELALPLTETHRALLERAEAAGWGELDNSAIIKVLRKKS